MTRDWPTVRPASAERGAVQTDPETWPLAALNPVALAALLGALPATHPLVVAARLGLQVGDDRRARQHAHRDTSHEIHGGERERWRRFGIEHVPYEELRRRRAVPGPMSRPVAS